MIIYSSSITASLIAFMDAPTTPYITHSTSLPKFEVTNGTVGTVTDFDINGRGEIQTIDIMLHGTNHTFRRDVFTSLSADATTITTVFSLDKTYAVTVRKAQGLTLDKIIVDTSKGLGMALGYTSFGRVREAGDLWITHLPSQVLSQIISINPNITKILAMQPLAILEEPEAPVEEPQAEAPPPEDPHEPEEMFFDEAPEDFNYWFAANEMAADEEHEEMVAAEEFGDDLFASQGLGLCMVLVKTTGISMAIQNDPFFGSGIYERRPSLYRISFMDFGTW